VGCLVVVASCGNASSDQLAGTETSPRISAAVANEVGSSDVVHSDPKETANRDISTGVTNADGGATESPAPSTNPATSSPPTSTTLEPPQPPEYVFPFSGRNVSYPNSHHTYPAADIFGCGAIVLAPTSGTIVQTRLVDLWDPATNNPAHRGGLYVTLRGDDGVRYYFAHLESVAVRPGQSVAPGTTLGIMGATGNARNSVCHTHFGISRPCPWAEWQVRRGEIWPQKYLDDWRNGGNASPTLQIYATILDDPEACERAYEAPHASAA
jgi:murein DD-endopeptidase MepM/ murein hydrolase activator NlpD